VIGQTFEVRYQQLGVQYAATIPLMVRILAVPKITGFT